MRPQKTAPAVTPMLGATALARTTTIDDMGLGRNAVLAGGESKVISRSLSSSTATSTRSHGKEDAMRVARSNTHTGNLTTTRKSNLFPSLGNDVRASSRGSHAATTTTTTPNSEFSRTSTHYGHLPRRYSRGESLGFAKSNPQTATTTITTTTQPSSSASMSTSPLEPIRHSASMLLLNRTAETIKSGQPMKRLGGVDDFSNNVFELRRQSSRDTMMSRQQSLIALFKLATQNEDSPQKKVLDASGLSLHELALRERAAYVLDKLYGGFSNVPPTALLKVQEQEGSVQEFVKNDGCVEDNPHLLAKATAENVQRIGILDLRIFNLDRHGGNILIKRKVMGKTRGMSSTVRANSSFEDMSTFLIGDEADETPSSFVMSPQSGNNNNNSSEGEIELTPIDHGMSLPCWTRLGEMMVDWTYYPQANLPLTATASRHVAEIDMTRDATALRELGIRESCVATNMIATTVLQAFCASCSTASLKDLASIWQRPYPSGHRLHHQLPSPLERFVDEALLRLGMSKEVFESPETPPPVDLYEVLARVVTEEVETGHWKTYVV